MSKERILTLYCVGWILILCAIVAMAQRAYDRAEQEGPLVLAISRMKRMPETPVEGEKDHD